MTKVWRITSFQHNVEVEEIEACGVILVIVNLTIGTSLNEGGTMQN